MDFQTLGVLIVGVLVLYLPTKILTKIQYITEYNIGHFIIGESIKIGISKVIKNFKKILR